MAAAAKACFWLLLYIPSCTIFLGSNSIALGLAPPNISVKKVSSIRDVMKLADLRYDEWIAGKYDTSRDAFRAATAELVEERKAAMVFLAELGKATVGAAELSPMELDGALTSNNLALYVTDVVTAQTHRRKGVARALMDALENDAMQRGVQYLLLHVESTNTAALSFYNSAGYSENLPSRLKLLDTEKLADNAGTIGQILMNKKLQLATKTKRGRTGGGGGFQKVS